jgi:geranylgeranyl diphosphate synthase type II
VLAGASSAEIEACELYAEKLGLAFQSKSQYPTVFCAVTWINYVVADDILDVTATTAELGKTAGKDQKDDKATYVKLLGLEESKRIAQKLIEEAKSALRMFGDRAIPLLCIADFIVSRNN